MLITGLSRIKWLFVIARNSSFAYKGQSPDIRQVGRELGVRYVLEGSVRKAAARVRITGQLVEADRCRRSACHQSTSAPGESYVRCVLPPSAGPAPRRLERPVLRVSQSSQISFLWTIDQVPARSAQ